MSDQNNAAVLYTQPSCGPCISVRISMERAGIEFDQVNIQADESSATFLKEELAYSGTPVVVIFDQDNNVLDHWGGGIRPDKAEEWFHTVPRVAKSDAA